jgi:NNMT/PNMT/TEMT family
VKQIRHGASGARRGGIDRTAPLISLTLRDALTFPFMGDAVGNVLRNADAPWNKFSPYDYWRRNYCELQVEDQEIIRRVSHFFIRAFAGRPLARRGIDVGSGTNLYPALLMLPWTEQILLTDFSESNVRWLRGQLAEDGAAWTWRPFWHEMQEAEGYNQIGEPRKQLREACVSEPGRPGIEQCSVFALPQARWDLGTMFFVAESITEDPAEFRTALACFTGALRPGAPFATAFMAGSDGYPVAGTRYPALPITPDDVRSHFTELGAAELSVDLLRTKHRVRDGWEGMIVATGFARGQ